MKFKISRKQFEFMKDFFGYSNNEIAEIELDPVMDTAAEHIVKQGIEQKAYKLGYDYGYKEGFYDAKHGHGCCRGACC